MIMCHVQTCLFTVHLTLECERLKSKMHFSPRKVGILLVMSLYWLCLQLALLAISMDNGVLWCINCEYCIYSGMPLSF